MAVRLSIRKRLLLAFAAGFLAYLAGSMLTMLAVVLAFEDRPFKYAIANAGGVLIGLIVLVLTVWSTRS